MARGLFESIDWLIAKDKKICCLIDNINNELAIKITNELGTPSFRSDTLVNLPAAGETGRMFISTDTFAFYRDNGTGWDLIGGPGIGTVTGSGTTNYLPKWTGSTALGNSLIYDNGTSVGIGTASPSASSILNLSSTTKGLLIPKMTGTQVEAIASPDQGLLAYSTDTSGTTVNQQGLWQYNAGSWQNTALKDDVRKLIWKYQNTFEYFSDFAQGSDGWNANNSGASSYANDANFQINSNSWFNGIACSTGTTATGRAAGYLGFGQSGNLGIIKGNDNSITEMYLINCIVTNLSTVADEYIAKFGLGYIGNNASEKFVGMLYNRLLYGDFWVLQLNDSGTLYTVVTNVPVVANTPYTFRVLITDWYKSIASLPGGSIRAWINGTEVVATSGTYPIPTAPVYNGNTSGLGRFHPTYGIWKSAGTNFRIVYIDGFYIYRNFLTNRFTL